MSEQSAAVVRAKIAEAHERNRQAERDLAMNLSLMKNAKDMHVALVKCAAYLSRHKNEIPAGHIDRAIVQHIEAECNRTLASVAAMAQPEPVTFSGLRTI